MLTQCPECAGQVSNHAEKCPHCGFVSRGRRLRKQRLEKTRRTVESLPDFSGFAAITFCLYLLGWLPGLLANAHFLDKAKKAKETYGMAPPGLATLWFMFWFFFLIPGLLLLLYILVVYLPRM